MKKNFFKKLSFVMALAMTASVVAPAASAFGATSPSLNVSTTKYLYLNETGKASEFDFNVRNGVAGSKYAYSSSNEAVAVVDEANGVTSAVSKGTATISVKITLPTKKTKTLKATVSVRDNIKTIDVVEPATEYVVGTEYDFDRTFETNGGSKTVTSSYSRWAIDKGVINAENGKFTATEAGVYNVTVNAFQSKAQYATWLETKDASLVKATDTVKVTVSASVVSTEQVDADTFKVTFDSDMSKTDIKTASVLYQVINGKNVSTGTEKIKAVTLDATGKIATIDMYAAFTAKTVYNYAFGKLTGTFTAATKEIKDVAGIVFDDFNATVGQGKVMTSSIKAVNKDGVVILSGTDIANYLSFTYGGDITKGSVVSTSATAYIYSAGYSAPVTAKFTNYVYDEVAKAYKTVSFEDSAVATGITANAATASTIQFDLATTITLKTDSTWKGNLTVPASETGYIHVRYYTSDNTTSYTYKNGEVLTLSPFTYESTDTSKLLITGNSFYPVSAGTVTVLVKDASKAIVATFDIVVTAARTFTSATQDVAALTIGNNSSVGEEKKATITVADSMGAAFTPSATYTFINKPASATDLNVTLTPSSGKVEVAVHARNNEVAGAYNLKVTVTGFGVSKDVYFNILVLEGNTAATTGVSAWAVESDSTTVDLKALYDKDVTVDVYGYNSNGVRVAQLVEGTDYEVSVKKGDTEVASGSNIIAVATGAPSTKTTTLEVGTYVANIYLKTAGITTYFNGSGRQDGSYFGAVVFTVTDSTTKTFTIENSTVVGGQILQMAKDAFKVTVNGTDLADTTIVGVKYSDGTGEFTTTTTPYTTAGTNVFIKELTVRVNDTATTNTMGYIEYTVAVGVTIAVR